METTFDTYYLAASEALQNPGNQLADSCLLETKEGKTTRVSIGSISRSREQEVVKTREQFLKAVEACFGPSVYKRLLASDYVSEEGPVSPEEVRAVSVLGTQRYISDIVPSFGQSILHRIREMRGTVRGTIFENMSPQEFAQLVHKYPSYPSIVTPSALTGIHSLVGSDPIGVAEWQQTLYRNTSSLLSQDPRIGLYHPWICRLVMAIINTFPKTEVVNEASRLIPCPSSDGDRGVEYYRLDKTIAKEGLCLFVLLPVSKTSNGNPIFLFRCTEQKLTEEDVFSSWGNDVEPNIGESGWKAAEKEIAAYMQGLEKIDQFKGKKILAAGYSLGAAHLGQFVRKYFPLIKEMVVFNGVGSPDDVIRDIAEKINRLPVHEIPFPITYYRNKRDWVNQAGAGHIGEGVEHPNALLQVFEGSYPGEKLPSENPDDINTEIWYWLSHHGRRLLDPMEPRAKITYFLGPKAFSHAFHYRRWEKVRQELGVFLSQVLYLIEKIMKFACRMIGVGFL